MLSEDSALKLLSLSNPGHSTLASSQARQPLYILASETPVTFPPTSSATTSWSASSLGAGPPLASQTPNILSSPNSLPLFPVTPLFQPQTYCLLIPLFSHPSSHEQTVGIKPNSAFSDPLVACDPSWWEYLQFYKALTIYKALNNCSICCNRQMLSAKVICPLRYSWDSPNPL